MGSDERPRPGPAAAARDAPDAATARWLAALAEHAREERVVGAAELPAPGGARRLRIVTTWHGFDAVCGELPRLGALVLGAPAAAELRPSPDRWEGVTADLGRATVEAVRIGDLLPSDEGCEATVLLDRNGVIDQWVRWSRGRARADAATQPTGASAFAFAADEEIQRIVGRQSGNRDGAAVRPGLARKLRLLRRELDGAGPSTAALTARIDELLRSVPQDGAGLRCVPGNSSPADAYDAFLRVADGEGFLGDRTLFDAAATKLGALSRRTPVFDEGFVVPTFDAVEVRWRMGEGTGGCKVPLVPCVHVGVAVAPTDDLEFWAAAAVRGPGTTIACVADDGRRDRIPRTAGRDAFLSGIGDAVDEAWDALPGLLRAARRAGRSPVLDADAALKPLHLPRSHREAALARIGPGRSVTRLAVALALTSAGDEAEPLVARKLAWAAGRLLATTP